MRQVETARRSDAGPSCTPGVEKLVREYGTLGQRRAHTRPRASSRPDTQRPVGARVELGQPAGALPKRAHSGVVAGIAEHRPEVEDLGPSRNRRHVRGRAGADAGDPSGEVAALRRDTDWMEPQVCRHPRSGDGWCSDGPGKHQGTTKRTHAFGPAGNPLSSLPPPVRHRLVLDESRSSREVA